jgi:hypothetical protein
MICKRAFVAPVGACLVALAWITFATLPACADDTLRDGTSNGDGTGGGAGKDADTNARDALTDPPDDGGTGGGAGQAIDNSGTGGAAGDAETGAGTGGGAGPR